MTTHYRKVWEVIGFTYEADYHCVPCTQKRFGRGPSVSLDNEGNEVYPIFVSDELDQDTRCGDCGAVID